MKACKLCCKHQLSLGCAGWSWWTCNITRCSCYLDLKSAPFVDDLLETVIWAMLVIQKLFPQHMTCQKMTQHVPVHSIRDLPNAPLCPFVGHLTPFFVRNLHLQTPNIGEYIQIGALWRFLPPRKTCHVSFSGRSLVVSRSLAIRACLAPETVDVGWCWADQLRFWSIWQVGMPSFNQSFNRVPLVPFDPDLWSF